MSRLGIKTAVPAILAAFVGSSGVAVEKVATTIPPFAGSVVELRNGVNEIDLNGDGAPDIIVRGYFENRNAHSHNLFAALIRVTDHRGGPRWDFVDFGDLGWNQPYVTSDKPHTGEDYVRFLVFAREQWEGSPRTTLYVAARDQSNTASIPEPSPVDVTKFVLIEHPGGGSPYSFERVAKMRLRHEYDNAALALVCELGFPMFPEAAASGEECKP